MNLLSREGPGLPVKGVGEDLDSHHVSHGCLLQGRVHCPCHHPHLFTRVRISLRLKKNPHPSSLPVENKLLVDHCLVDQHRRESNHPPDDIVKQPREDKICSFGRILGNSREPWPEASIGAFVDCGREEIRPGGERTHNVRISGPGGKFIIFEANQSIFNEGRFQKRVYGIRQ